MKSKNKSFKENNPSNNQDDELMFKKRIDMLTFDDDDEDDKQIDAIRQQRIKEAKQQIVVNESISQSRYKSVTNEDLDEASKSSANKTKNGKYNYVISLDSECHGSLIPGSENNELDEYMPLKPTQYMLENPIYDNIKQQEKENSYEEMHCFMNRNKKQDKSTDSVKYGEEDICNLQDSQNETFLNKTIELKPNIRRHDSV